MEKVAALSGIASVLGFVLGMWWGMYIMYRVNRFKNPLPMPSEETIKVDPLEAVNDEEVEEYIKRNYGGYKL